MSMPKHPAASKAVAPPNTYQGDCSECWAKSFCGPSDNFPSDQWSNMDSEFANQFVITRSNPDIDLHLANIGSFDLTNLKIKQRPMEEWLLPPYIPKVIASGGFPLGLDLPKWTYGMSIHTLTGRQDMIIDRPWTKKLRSMFPEGSQLILDMFSPDNYVDPLWQRYARYKIPYWDQEVFQQFDAIIAPNISLYLDDPMMQRHISQKQTFMLTQQMYDQGIKNVVPLLCFDNEETLRRNIEYIASNMGDIHTIAIQLHQIQIDRIAALKYNLELLYKYVADLPFRFIINGLTSSWSIRECRRMFETTGDPNRFSYMNVGPWMETQRLSMSPLDKSNYFKNEISRFTRYGRGLDLPKGGEIIYHPEKRPEGWEEEQAELAKLKGKK